MEESREHGPTVDSVFIHETWSIYCVFDSDANIRQLRPPLSI